MDKFVRVLKEGVLWLTVVAAAIVFCYGVAAVVSVICGLL